MTVQSFIMGLPLRKFVALCVLGIIIPQAIPLLTRLVWAMFIIIVVILCIELCGIFVLKIWFPNTINVSHVFSWTIETLFRVGTNLLNIALLLVYSSFDLAFGTAFHGSRRVRSSRSNQRRENLKELAPSKVASEKLKLFSRDGGYTPMARKAMSNSATKPKHPRFSL